MLLVEPAALRSREHARPAAAALAGLAIAGIALGLVQLAMVLSGPQPGPRWALALYPAVAAIYLAAGVVAWLRRPSNRMGALIVAGAFVWLAAGFANTTVPALAAAGSVLATVPFAIIVHLLHGFPSGRLRGRLSIAAVLAGYFVCLVMQAPQYLFAIPGALRVADRPDLADAGLWAQWALGSCVMVVTAAILERRRRRVPPARRRMLAPLLVYGIGAVLFVPLSGQLAHSLLSGDGWPVVLEVSQLAVLAAVPVAFAIAMLRGGFARTLEIVELGSALSADPVRRPPLAEVLAGALGDPSLELAFWARDAGAYVDHGGRPRELPPAGEDRAAVEVLDGPRPIGAIVYDATLIADPGLVRAAGRVVALALDNERLTAELRASRERLRASRTRIVETADSERRRIARDLHDGVQARLVLLAMRADSLGADSTASVSVRAEAARLRSGLQAAITELRELVQDIMPATLTERGLLAAAHELADRAPIPIELQVDANGASLPARVESTGYFVVCEALANAIKHSRARELVVRIGHGGGALRIEVCDDGIGGARPAGGAGMRGMADRVDALGGRLVVESPIGGGTSVVAEVPCAA